MNLRFFTVIIALCCSLLANHQTVAQHQSPDELFGDLFVQVQTQKIFKDHKTFVDCTPKEEVSSILKLYDQQKNSPTFHLKSFVEKHFYLPDTSYVIYKADTASDIRHHIDTLWGVLTRKAQKPLPHSSLIALPYPYVIPGGRFREVFYWDSYFIMLGLQQSGKQDLLKNMLANFSFLIDSLGFIPNGNRTYFLSRSQPPFYALMVDLLVQKDSSALLTYLPQLEKEYRFWMDGTSHLSQDSSAYKRVVQLPDGSILNRYWDDKNTPRPEAYGKELAYSAGMSLPEKQTLYRHIRAACESGWDFSTRWFRDQQTIQTIHTTDIVPVDLNCLLYFLENSIARGYKMQRNEAQANVYKKLAANRKNAILRYCWNSDEQFFMDYDYVARQTTSAVTLAGAFPLFFQLATNEQAKQAAAKLEQQFLKPGGFVTTLHRSHFQWDSPNGWAPLQFTTVQGLLHYGYKETALKGALNWTSLNRKVYKQSGKLVEKYNVLQVNSLTGGGEYALQDGFGWTNGVYLVLDAFITNKPSHETKPKGPKR